MIRVLAAACAVLAVAGCERTVHDMYRQPRLDRGEASPLFSDGRADRPPPAGSVPMAAGTLAMTSSGRKGHELPALWQAAGEATAAPAVTEALLARGRQRYEIYCLPCHSPLGDGDGPIVRRGFPQPPSYHEQRLRDAPDRHFFDVIGNGYGVMHGYGDRVAPQDRWAIVAYIRALQWSQHVEAARLPDAVRAKLPANPRGGAR